MAPLLRNIWFLWSEGVKKLPHENVSIIWRRLYWYEKESVPEDGKIPEWQKMHHWWRLLWASDIVPLCAPKNILHSWHWTFMEPINQYLWDVNNCVGKCMFLPQRRKIRFAYFVYFSHNLFSIWKNTAFFSFRFTAPNRRANEVLLA